jgi:predicted CoA-binding protein
MKNKCEVPSFSPNSKEIERVLKNAKTIAVVGLSSNPEKDSYHVAEYLIKQGYEVIPVNPNQEEILGKKCYPSLLTIPEEIKIDIVDIFRKPEDVPPIVDDAIKRGVGAIWMQEGIVNNQAGKKAKEKGLFVVMGKCIMKTHLSMILQK